MKRTLAIFLSVLLAMSILPVATYADETFEGESRVTMGADLSASQREQVYRDFGIEQGEAQELTVTNAEERVYLEGKVSERKIGHKALSCAYISILGKGEGLRIELYNINYCTKEMYENALITAGITDAKVIISAPFAVSGTGALTGIYKAYEAITGSPLSELAKAVGADELVLTGELSEYIGGEDAAAIINELKKILDETQNMTDEEVIAEIRAIAKEYNVELTDAQIMQLLDLCRKLEGLDVGQLQSRLVDLAKGVETAGKFVQGLGNAFEGVKQFFANVGAFFAKIFSKK